MTKLLENWLNKIYTKKIINQKKQIANSMANMLLFYYLSGRMALVVRCGQCKHLMENDKQGEVCDILKMHFGSNGFCPLGEPRSIENEES